MKRTALVRRTPLRRTAPLRVKRTSNDIPASSRRAVSRRSGGICEARLDGCTGWAVHMHHRLPRRYGNHEPSNLLHLCFACHEAVHKHRTLSYAFGFLIRGAA